MSTPKVAKNRVQVFGRKVNICLFDVFKISILFIFYFLSENCYSRCLVYRGKRSNQS